MELEEIRARLATIENLRRRDNDQVTHFELLAVLKEKTAIYEAVLEAIETKSVLAEELWEIVADSKELCREALRAREVAR